jgi:hypothetical protein
LVLTETVCKEPIVVSAGSAKAEENIVARKTIVYETLVDPTVLRVASEKLRTQLFSRFGLLKPKPEEIQFVSIDKYYEPYIVVSGRYVIDYYRKCTYNVRVEEGVQEVILFGNKIIPELPPYSDSKEGKALKLTGEERLVNEAKASFIFDRYGRDATLERLPSARPEKNPHKIMAKFGIEKVAENADVDFVRSRLVSRPSDVERIVAEIFEVGERVVIYTPKFRILYRNVKTGEERAMEFDGVTSERVQQRESAISQSIKIIKSRLT